MKLAGIVVSVALIQNNVVDSNEILGLSFVRTSDKVLIEGHQEEVFDDLLGLLNTLLLGYTHVYLLRCFGPAFYIFFEN